MKYNLAFKYRIYPNKDQELLINKTFGCVRFVYNTILYTANKFYEETGKNKIITPASLKSENQFLKIDKWFPSSKTCSKCGNVKEELKLSERSYKCECCGIEIDRDYNAALNIRDVGKEMLKY